MSRYDHLVYGRYTHLLRDYFKELKSIFKKEVYKGAYEIYLPLQFRSIYHYAQIPFNAVAVLWMSFEYETLDGSHIREILQFGSIQNPPISPEPPSSTPPPIKPRQASEKPSSAPGFPPELSGAPA